MALTIVNNEASAARLSSTVTTITVGVAGDYSAGGIALTPAQLGFGNEVFYGSASVLTPGGAGTVTDCTLDCTNPKAPKLKANAAAAEAAGAGVAGAVLVVVAWGD